MSRSIAGLLGIMFVAAACGNPARQAPTPPPIPRDPQSLRKADSGCQYDCATYHYSANECFQGWQCDASGSCLTYVGTPDQPTACPLPPPPSSPYEISWCASAPITTQQILSRFAPASTSAVLGSVTLDARQRQCQDQTGCADWTASTSVPFYQINDYASGNGFTFDHPTIVAVPAMGTATCTVPGPSCQATIGNLTTALLPDTANPSFGWNVSPRIDDKQVQVGSWSSDPRGNYVAWGPVVTSNTCLFGTENGRVYGSNGVYTEYEIVIYGQYAAGPGTSCTPTTCAAHDFDCGTIPDGCGGTLDCGSCGAQTTCGGGGSANVCGFADSKAHDAYCGSTHGTSSYSCSRAGTCQSRPYPEEDWVCGSDLCWTGTALTCVDGTLH